MQAMRPGNIETFSFRQSWFPLTIDYASPGGSAVARSLVKTKAAKVSGP